MPKQGILFYKKRVGAFVYKLTEAFYDRKLGIHTKGYVIPEDLGKKADGCHAYLAVSYGGLKRVLNNITQPAKDVVMIDYGAGMGRVPIFAATYTFRKIIGVELSKQLHDIAVKNTANAKQKNNRARKNPTSVEMVQSDAREYKIPIDANVFYFFIPFNIEILQEVLQNIHRSVKKHPREATILYVYPTTETKIHLHTLKPILPWLHILEEEAVSKSLRLITAQISA
jgi:16S rRNA G966 N2-methylase RsmD